MLLTDSSQCFQLFSGVYHAGRVGRGVEHEHLGLFGDCCFQLVSGNLEMVLSSSANFYRNSASHANHLCVAQPVRSCYNNLVARITASHDSEVYIVLCAGCYNNLARLIFQTKIFLHAVANCLSQFDDAGSRGISGLVCLNSSDACFLDVFRGVKVRLTCAKADNVDAVGLHLLCHCADCQRGGRSDCGCNFRNWFNHNMFLSGANSFRSPSPLRLEIPHVSFHLTI